METEKLLLRRWTEEDAPILYKYASDPDIGPRAGWPIHQSIEFSKEVIRKYFDNDKTWAIVVKTSSEPIGCIGYLTHEMSNITIGKNDCEIGYWIAKPYWNKGLCTEALLLILNYCINTIHFSTIWGTHFVSNLASGRVMKKCGFHDTGMLNKCSHLVGGDNEMIKIFKLSRTEVRTCNYQ